MENCDWAKIDTSMANGFAQGMMQLKPAFVERFGDALSGANIEILDRLALSAPGYWRYSLECKNQVAAHWDFRGDNMLFGQRNGELAMVTIDWTALMRRVDLGHFLAPSGSGVRKTRIGAVEALHDSLLGARRERFSLQSHDEYRRNLFYPCCVVR